MCRARGGKDHPEVEWGGGTRRTDSVCPIVAVTCSHWVAMLILWLQLALHSCMGELGLAAGELLCGFYCLDVPFFHNDTDRMEGGEWRPARNPLVSLSFPPPLPLSHLLRDFSCLPRSTFGAHLQSCIRGETAQISLPRSTLPLQSGKFTCALMECSLWAS